MWKLTIAPKFGAEIDLASPSPRGLPASRHDFLKTEKYGKDFVAGFAKNESLYRQSLTKYKWSKLFWRVLEDNKQNKRENRGKKTVRIINLCVQTTHTLRYSQTRRIPFRLAFFL